VRSIARTLRGHGSEHAPDEPVELGQDQQVRVRRFVLRVVASLRQLSGQHLVQNAPNCVEVRALVGFLSGGELRRRIGSRSRERLALRGFVCEPRCEHRGLERVRGPEVGDLDAPTEAEQVPGLHVSVNQPAVVYLGDGAKNFTNALERSHRMVDTTLATERHDLVGQAARACKLERKERPFDVEVVADDANDPVAGGALVSEKLASELFARELPMHLDGHLDRTKLPRLERSAEVDLSFAPRSQAW